MSATITSGSMDKLKGCLETHVRKLGGDPSMAHDWTILGTPDEQVTGKLMPDRRRILVSIEVRPQP